MNSSSPRRVVITGLGLISPLGNTPESLWEALISRQSGVAPLQSIPQKNLPITFAAEARQFTGNIDDFGPLEKEPKKAIRKGLKIMCRETQMGVAAAQLALSHAGLNSGTFDPERTGAVFGSDYMLTMPEDFVSAVGRCKTEDGGFDYDRWPTEGMPQLSPLWLLKYLPNMPASHVAIYNDLRGPNNSITLREAAAYLAIGEAFRTIARGSADAIVTGATGTRVHPSKTVHAIQTEQVATGDQNPEQLSRPFDLNRTGVILGEGAGCVVLEELETAKARGATIYGEVVGFGASQASTRDAVALRSTAIANVLRSALKDAGIAPEEVGHLHAHGLSTKSSDLEEAQAIGEVFGPSAQTVPVVAAKANFGNLGAGSGAVELIASVLALKHGKLFPALNYETADPECPLAVVTGEVTPAGESFVTVSVTPQGQASALVIRAFRE